MQFRLCVVRLAYTHENMHFLQISWNFTWCVGLDITYSQTTIFERDRRHRWPRWKQLIVSACFQAKDMFLGMGTVSFYLCPPACLCLFGDRTSSILWWKFLKSLLHPGSIWVNVILAFVYWLCIDMSVDRTHFLRVKDSDWPYFCVFLEEKSYFNALTWVLTICVKWYSSIWNAAVESRRKENPSFSSFWTFS